MAARQSALESIREPQQTPAEEHAMLDRLVRELERRAFRTPAEQSELASLKRRKLKAKDRLSRVV